MKYSDSNLPAVGTEVTLAECEAEDYTAVDLPRGTVIDHTEADMMMPDDGVVLVRWSRTHLRWEYGDDLQDAADLLAKM